MNQQVVQFPSKFVLIALLFAVLVKSNPDGDKLQPACETLSPCPYMTGQGPQTSKLPYNVRVDSTRISPSGSIHLIMTGNADTPFLGFMLQARAAGSSSLDALGTWSVLEPAKSVTIDCGSGKANTLVHKDATPKTSVLTRWDAPSSNLPVAFNILLTVVEDVNTYWNKTLAARIITNGESDVNPICIGEDCSKEYLL